VVITNFPTQFCESLFLFILFFLLEYKIQRGRTVIYFTSYAVFRFLIEFLRGDDRFVAGSRFKYIEPKIEFTYESLANAIYTAIDKQVEADGTGAATEEYNPFYQKEQERTFEEIRDEAKELWNKLVTETNSEENAQKISFIIEKTFGRKMKLSDITESQKDLFELVVTEMKSLIK
jgi:hypothetical protein